jgi:hypothetical protein
MLKKSRRDQIFIDQRNHLFPHFEYFIYLERDGESGKHGRALSVSLMQICCKAQWHCQFVFRLAESTGNRGREEDFEISLIYWLRLEETLI